MTNTTARTVKAEDIRPGMVIKSASRWYTVTAIKSVTDWSVTFTATDSRGNAVGYLSAYRDGIGYPVKEA